MGIPRIPEQLFDAHTNHFRVSEHVPSFHVFAGAPA